MCKPLLASINSPRLCGHSVGLVCNCDSCVVYSLFSYHQKNLGGPGSSRGTLEHIRAGLTVYSAVLSCTFWKIKKMMRKSMRENVGKTDDEAESGLYQKSSLRSLELRPCS